MNGNDRDVSGGCQCGAVRYRLTETPRGSLVCHCRMCQKAFSAPFAAFVGAPADAVVWTRGAPAIFRSSERVERGFCSACGSALTFARPGGDWLNIATFSLDEPAAFPPAKQFAPDQAVLWLAELDHLPARQLEGGPDPDGDVRQPVTSFQYPDHDTASWPQTGDRP